MRIIFAGTPEFSVLALEALLAEGHDVVAVYTQPDRKSGRGRKTQPSPVKLCAQKYDLHIEQPLNLNDAGSRMKEFSADVMVVVAYGIILPQEILQIPEYGCLNIHASLLPRWRGAAPIHRAIEAGDVQTGITIMQMDTGLDTGNILASYPVNIESADTAESLHDRLAILGADAITEVLMKLSEHQQTAQPQQQELASYAKKISREEASINWAEDCQLIERRIRAFNPWPGTQTEYQGIKLRIWQAECEKETPPSAPGTVLSADKSGIRIACGAGSLKVIKLQRAGGKTLSAADFINGMPLDAGVKLENAGNA